jgi:hypothetical protein
VDRGLPAAALVRSMLVPASLSSGRRITADERTASFNSQRARAVS